MTTYYICERCDKNNRDLGEKLSKYFDSEGIVYKILLGLLGGTDYWTKWENVKRHLEKKHEIKDPEKNPDSEFPDNIFYVH